MASDNALRCKIGISLDEDCHIKSLCRNIGFYPISSFTEENKELLELRCELQFAEEDEVCYHHEKAYLSSYQRLQKKCADPYKQHLKKQVKSKSRVISLNIFLIYQYYFLKIINVSS